MDSNEQKTISVSTQSFLILCRLFDNCYDELSKQGEIQRVVEETANAMLAGVQFLQEQATPPKTIEIQLSFQQVFFLRKIIEMHNSLMNDEQKEKTRVWMDECIEALQKAIQ